MGSIYRRGRRVGVAIVGGLVLLVGVVTIPYPGPGWLIVFAGLGILATEFDWARRLLGYTRGKYDSWQEWLRKQSMTVKVMFWLMTALVVVTTIWLLNGYGLLSDLLNLELDWIKSPLVK